jgi:hypothetical protein
VTETREVREFAWRVWVSRYVWDRQRSDVRVMLQADLEAKAREQGHEPLPGTFGYHVIRPTSDDVFMLSAEDREFLETRDVVWVRTWLRCYSIEAAT